MLYYIRRQWPYEFVRTQGRSIFTLFFTQIYIPSRVRKNIEIRLWNTNIPTQKGYRDPAVRSHLIHNVLMQPTIHSTNSNVHLTKIKLYGTTQIYLDHKYLVYEKPLKFYAKCVPCFSNEDFFLLNLTTQM